MASNAARPSINQPNNNNQARRGLQPASAAPRRTAATSTTGGHTSGGLFAHAGQRAQTSPRRTPRASLSVSSAAAAAPGTRRTVAAPLTPSLSNAQLKAHQLVRTPASRRRERIATSAAGRGGASAAVAGTASKSRWRASLAGVPGPEAAAKLAERHEVVRVTASDALEELLEVGLDAAGEENGSYAISEKTQSLVTVFQGSKSKYLSDAPFLETGAIAHVLPQEANDPNSRLNALVRICNLTTFMHLVLSAAPDPGTGVSTHDGLNKLRQAADAMLRHVKPPQDPINDATLKLLVDLKCQMYIAAASLARGQVDATPYFSAPLSSHLPHAASIAMTDRSASAKFASMQSHALNTITETGGDWVVLRTKWTWSATVTDTRNWVEGIVLNSGLGLGTPLANDLEQDAEREDSPVSEDRESPAGGDPFGTPTAAFTGGPSQQAAAIAAAADAPEAPTNEEDAESDFLVVEEVEQLEVVQVAEEIEEDADADEDEDDDSVSRRSANASGRNSAEGSDDQLAEEEASTRARGDESPASDDASLDDAAEAAQVESFLQLFTELRPEESLGDVSTGLGVAARHSPLPGAAADHVHQADAVESELEDEGPGTLEGELFQMLGEHGDDETMTANAIRDGLAAGAATTTAPAQGTLRFNAANQLYRDAAPKSKSAFFDNRQPGEKIQFDSQSIGGEDEQPVAGPSGANRRRRRRSASSEQRSPEQFRGREERLASPLPSRRVLENEDDDDDDAPRPAPAAVPLHDTQAFEADHYADEFGGGFDEAGGSDRSEIAVAHHANRARDGGASKARQRAAPGAKRRGTSAAKQPSAQVKRAAAFAGSLAAGAPASSRKATAARRSDSPTSDFDSLSSSDGDTSVDSRRQIRRPSTQKHREAPNRKRQRVDRFVLSSDDEPVERDRSQSKRQRRIDPPRAAGSGNIYFQDRNQPGARIDWTPEETRLLHQYLREYGCDWKRMMERSGPHGTEDQTFRNRTNVSLKDKAVNEKLWLLKHGHEVPGYFAGVHVPASKLPRVQPQLRAIETDESE
ncbi:hypothetical protein B0A53_06388 [Rhodotorula sp. CCFEE 5036]|nr:hypothetical protein B0A53_06388 [Rhodotorula sp. CCFEE 5036]